MATTLNLTGVLYPSDVGVDASQATSLNRYKKAMFAYGATDYSIFSLINQVSNTGVVSTDGAQVGTARYLLVIFQSLI